MFNDGVQTAFELILEEIGSASNELKESVKLLVDKGDFDAVTRLINTAKSLDSFQLKVSDLQSDWIETFDPETRSKTQFTPSEEMPETSEALSLTMAYGDATAQAEYIEKNVRVLVGSSIRKHSFDSLSDNSKERKAEAIRNGEIELSQNTGLYVVKVPITFSSPSGAACFVAGCAVSGPKEWKVRGQDISLKDWFHNHNQ